ncbi:MAG: M20/M25/M40 family metallo-hydrolase [Luteibacter sp.]
MKPKWNGQVHWIGLTALLIAFIAIAGIVRFRLDTPYSIDDDDTRTFSIARSVSVLSRVLGDERPHAVDTDANGQVRKKIIGNLTDLGYKAEVQEATSCSNERVYTCALVKNIVAVYGDITPRMVMLSAHYDSVEAGPGASDDGSGVAILLEVARLLKQSTPGKNGVILLFTDGEEAGLLGARAFLTHPLAKHVAVAINAEARGTSGQSTLFETANSSGWLVNAFAATAGHPLANSFVSTVYKILPNNTDLTIFKSAGIQGLNFAFGEHSAFYHTNNDTLKALNSGSLQQQGENIYRLSIALQAYDIPEANVGSETVYTDFAGLGMILWPSWMGRVLAIVLLLMFSAMEWRLRRSDAYSPVPVLKGVLVVPLSVVVGGASAYLLVNLMGLINSNGFPWHVSAIANRALIWATALLAVLLVQRLLVRKSNGLGIWMGVIYGWILFATVTALILPGVSYLFLIPSIVAIVAVIAFFALPVLKGRLATLVLPPALPAFALLIQAIFLTEIMLGFNSPVGPIAMGMFLGAALTFCAPYLSGMRTEKTLRYGAAALSLLVIGSAFASIRAPAHDAEQPQSVNIMYLQKHDDEAYFLATGSAPPADVLRAMGSKAAVVRNFPELNDQYFSTSVASAAIPAAGLTVLDQKTIDGGRQIVVRLDADAQTRRIRLLIPSAMSLRSIEMEGKVLNYSGGLSQFGPYSAFVCRGENCNGRQLTMTLGTTSQMPVVIEKFAPLPENARAVVESRNVHATQRQDGDESVVVNRVNL